MQTMKSVYTSPSACLEACTPNIVGPELCSAEEHHLFETDVGKVVRKLGKI